MSLTTKLLLILGGIVLVLGAIPIMSDADEIPLISGTWAGKGEGNCHPPGTTLYPWQHWKGTIPNDCKTFAGEWKDEKGHYGKFKGEIKWISITTIIEIDFFIQQKYALRTVVISYLSFIEFGSVFEDDIEISGILFFIA